MYLIIEKRYTCYVNNMGSRMETLDHTRNPTCVWNINVWKWRQDVENIHFPADIFQDSVCIIVDSLNNICGFPSLDVSAVRVHAGGQQRLSAWQRLNTNTLGVIKY